MTVELLISTMHQNNYALLDKMSVCSDAVVVNQCDRDGSVTFLHHGHKIKWIDTTKRGLSCSRNEAIRNASADICIIADDDMEYRNGYADLVLEAFEEVNADIIGFQVLGIEKPFKTYYGGRSRVFFLRSMKMSSVELAFRRESFINNGIIFNELIGAGTKYPMGEENAMLIQCLKKNMTVYYYPKVIGDLHIGDSTWFDGYNEHYFIGKGAAYTAMERYLSGFLILQFAIRKKHLYQHEMSMLSAISNMYKGRKQYLRDVKK